MALVTVIATASFSHRGEQIHRGQAITVEALEAAELAQARRVTLDRSARATYHTTDLVAERPIPPPLVVVSEPVASVASDATAVETTPARRRRRSRRTHTA